MVRTDWKQLEEKIGAAVKLARRPVAVSFLDAAPVAVKRFDGTEPSGCSFWRLAANGGVFYTVPENHFNCAVGAYTHNIELSPEREKETEQTLKMMFDLGYVKPEEVPQIPRLAKAPSATQLKCSCDRRLQLFRAAPRNCRRISPRIRAKCKACSSMGRIPRCCCRRSRRAASSASRCLRPDSFPTSGRTRKSPSALTRSGRCALRRAAA